MLKIRQIAICMKLTLANLVTIFVQICKNLAISILNGLQIAFYEAKLYLISSFKANTTVQQQYQQPLPHPTVDKGIDINSETDSNHDTALTLACAGGHEELVALLITRGASIEHRDKKGFTPLILASTAGHEKVVDVLLKAGADLEAQSERTKDTPLSLACSGGRYEVVELLISVGANKEHRNVSDYTPLSLAASGGYVNIIKLLLTHGAEINSRTGSKLGISPLMLAAMNGHTAAVKLLLDQGSDINAQIETNRNTALTLACFQGRHEVVSLLLDRKANVEHRAKTGLTPLMEAASGGYIEVGRVLLDKGADVNAAPVPTSRDTALTIAADKGHLKFVELLLSRGAAVEVKNKKGNSPLWLAAHGGHLSVVEILYQHLADIDSQDHRKVSCLMAAFRKGHTKVVKWMVQYVTQFPSDQEMSRFISTISDKELIEKCYDCMRVIRAAKEAQAVKANKNASILLEELDMERTREESRRAAAARRRERKKKKKMEKKQEKRRQLQGEEGSNADNAEKEDDVEDKDSEKEDDSEREDNAEEDDEPRVVAHYREEGDSGIDQGSCSSGDIKAANAQNVDKNNKNKNKKKKQSQQSQLAGNSSPLLEEAPPQSVNKQNNNSNNNNNKANNKQKEEQKPLKNSKKVNSEQTTKAPPAAKNKLDSKKQEEPAVTAAVTGKKSASAQKDNNKQREKENQVPKEAEVFKSQQSTPITTNNTANNNNNTSSSAARKSLVFSSARNSNEEAVTTQPPKMAPKRGEDGWKEVVRKSGATAASTTPTNASTPTPGASSTATSGSNASSAPIASSSSCEMVCKKVQVPVNAISRVIGRAGSNINAIRATTGAHIEVEKQGKNQSERSITIKGVPDATKQAHMLILALIKDPDVDILQMLPRISSSIKNNTLSSMTFGTWDNKTAAAAAATPTSSASSTTSSNSSSTNNNNGSNVPAVPRAASNVSKVPRNMQVSKAFYNQQPQAARAQIAAGLLPTLNSKQPVHKSSDMLNNFGRSYPSSGGGGAASKQKLAPTTQSFAAKLTASNASTSSHMSGASERLHGSPAKKSESIVRSGTTIPFGRGKPLNVNLTAQLGTTANNDNTLSGPIGTFNVADVAAINAAAAAAAQALSAPANASETATEARAVTPIGPPKRQASTPPLAATQVDNTFQLGKISSQYSLFNDNYQTNWGANSVSDNLPQADASKAPGYNRNILSSPVGGGSTANKQTSSQSTPTTDNLSVNTSDLANGNGNATPPSSQTASNANTQLSKEQNANTAVAATLSPAAAIKPPAPIGQRSYASNNNNNGSAGNNANNGSVAARSTASPTLNFAAGNRYFEHAAAYHLDHSVANATYAAANNAQHNMSRLNPRANTFSQTAAPLNNNNNNNKAAHQGQALYNPQIPPPAAIGAYNANKSLAPGAGLAASRPQSQPQVGLAHNQRWYGGGGGGASNEFAGYVPNAREILNLENGSTGSATSGNSPAAMSPNQQQTPAHNGLLSAQQQQPQVTQEDLRKVPRPIGTERASWKYNHQYPLAGNAQMGNIDETLAMNVGGGAPLHNLMGNTGPWLPPWMPDNKQQQNPLQQQQQQQQQQMQQYNWMKPAYRNYGANNANATGAGVNMSAAAGYGMPPADYHAAQDPFNVS